MSYTTIITKNTPASPPPSPKMMEKQYFFRAPPTSNGPTRSTKWADGLRGISSLFVLSSHLVLSFDRSLVLPSNTIEGPTQLFQRPILRLISQGQAFVAIFFVLLGYVNSLKVIKLSRQGKVDEALRSLASASFRRTGRLVFPAATITILCWFGTQIGVFDLARESDAYWLRVNSAPASETWELAIIDLFRELIGTWLIAENRYDQPQWALFHLFKASMYVFMFLLATVRITPKARMIALAGLWWWSWAAGDCLVGANVFFGVFLAELTYIDTTSDDKQHSPTYSTLSILLPYLTLPLAFTLMSHPSSYTQLTPWSATLQYLGETIFSSNSDIGRAWPGVGAQLFCTCILFSAGLRRFFSLGPFMWLGGVSYTLYLLHGPLMRSLLAWMVFLPVKLRDQAQYKEVTEAFDSGSHEGVPTTMAGFERVTDPQYMIKQEPDQEAFSYYSLPNKIVLAATISMFLILLLLCVAAWSKKVEPWFARATAVCEKWCINGGVGGRDDGEGSRSGRSSRSSSASGENGEERERGLPMPVTAGEDRRLD